MQNYFSLNEICNNSRFVLVDACSFIVPYEFSTDRTSLLKDRLERSEASNRNLSFWIENIPIYSNIYSTEGIKEELREIKYKYKKSIKLPIVKDKEYIVKLRRKLSENKKSSLNLANLLESNKRIFVLHESEEEIYKSFYKKYSSLKEEFQSSNVDFDFFVLGCTLSTENPTALISNDFKGIRSIWLTAVNKDKFLRDNLVFYSNPYVASFKKAWI